MTAWPEEDDIRAVLREINIRAGRVLPSMKSPVEQAWFRAGPCPSDELQTVRVLRSEGVRI